MRRGLVRSLKGPLLTASSPSFKKSASCSLQLYSCLASPTTWAACLPSRRTAIWWTLCTIGVVFIWCTNNCNYVFKRQVAQRTKNSTVSCGAEMLSLRRGGERKERRLMKSRGRCRDDRENMAKRSPAPRETSPVQRQLLWKLPLTANHHFPLFSHLCLWNIDAYYEQEAQMSQ